MTHVALI